MSIFEYIHTYSGSTISIMDHDFSLHPDFEFEEDDTFGDVEWDESEGEEREEERESSLREREERGEGGWKGAEATDTLPRSWEGVKGYEKVVDMIFDQTPAPIACIDVALSRVQSRSRDGRASIQKRASQMLREEEGEEGEGMKEREGGERGREVDISGLTLQGDAAFGGKDRSNLSIRAPDSEEPHILEGESPKRKRLKDVREEFRRMSNSTHFLTEFEREKERQKEKEKEKERASGGVSGEVRAGEAANDAIWTHIPKRKEPRSPQKERRFMSPESIRRFAREGKEKREREREKEKIKEREKAKLKMREKEREKEREMSGARATPSSNVNAEREKLLFSLYLGTGQQSEDIERERKKGLASPLSHPLSSHSESMHLSGCTSYG